jgi:hypothetical protein
MPNLRTAKNNYIILRTLLLDLQEIQLIFKRKRKRMMRPHFLLSLLFFLLLVQPAETPPLVKEAKGVTNTHIKESETLYEADENIIFVWWWMFLDAQFCSDSFSSISAEGADCTSFSFYARQVCSGHTNNYLQEFC